MNNFRTHCLLTLVIPAIITLSADSTVQAQLSREVREKFESMLDDLDIGTRAQFQRALDNNTPVVELTPKQFRQFRNHPVNPFEIDDIDPDDLDGNIELRFELPSIRNRPVQPYERQSRSLRRNLRDVIGSTASSTVRITDGNQQIAFGTIVQKDGMILTKASELDLNKKIYCQLGPNRTYQAEVIRTNTENDLALLKINAGNLTPVSWSDKQPLNGSFVVIPNELGEVMSVGTYSVVPRSTIGENRALLGVFPQNANTGVVVADEVEPGTAAFAAGLLKGDVITSIDGLAIDEVDELVNEIRKRHAGDEIDIAFLRNGTARTTKAKLAKHNLSGERAARFKMMSRLGAVPSERDSNFPVVFQHDAPIFPEQCGGPICDLQGNVLGINIARESRAASYAIPANHLQTILNEMLRHDVAARSNESR